MYEPPNPPNPHKMDFNPNTPRAEFVLVAGLPMSDIILAIRFAFYQKRLSEVVFMELPQTEYEVSWDKGSLK
jgi:hypothetical protein